MQFRSSLIFFYKPFSIFIFYDSMYYFHLHSYKHFFSCHFSRKKHKIQTTSLIFILKTNRPGFLLRKPGRSYTLLSLTLSAHQQLTQLLAGVLDCSLSSSQNYRAFGITICYSFNTPHLQRTVSLY